MMEEAGVVGAALTAARGWLTPAVLFVAMNLVIATIAVASRLMSSPGDGDGDEAAGERRGLFQRALSFLRSSFSFSSRLRVASDHALAQVVQPQPQPLFGDDGVPNPGPSLQQQPQPVAEADQQPEAEHSQREEARVERSRSEAAAEAPSNRRRAATEELLDGLGGEEGEAAVVEVEVDARADDFIRRFREQLRLQRLDSILRYRDRDASLRRTGTA